MGKIRVGVLALWGVAVVGASASSPLHASGQEASGQLVVVTTPPGAAIEVDGRSVGHAPATVTDLLPGAHVVLARGAGAPVQRVVEVAPGRSTVVELDMPAAVEDAAPPPAAAAAASTAPDSATPAAAVAAELPVPAPSTALPEPVEGNLGVVPASVAGWRGGRQYDYGLVIGGGATFVVGLILFFVGLGAIGSRSNEGLAIVCLPLGSIATVVGGILALVGIEPAFVGVPGVSDSSGARFGAVSPWLEVAPDGARVGALVTW